MLKLRIASSRIVEGTESEKKFVAYMLQVRTVYKEPLVHDQDPVNVERRYTQFLDLYNGLKKENPALLNNLSFPRKVSCFVFMGVFRLSFYYFLCIFCVKIQLVYILII